MARERVIIDHDKMYELTRDERGQEFLSVVCGGIAMYEITIMLTEDEMHRWKEWGKEWALDDLAYKLCKNVDGMQKRAIPPQ